MSDELRNRIREAAIDVQTESVSASVPISDLASWADRDEHVFRLNYAIDPDDDAQLNELRGSDPVKVLRRWAFVKHLYHRRAHAVRTRDAEKARVARQLLQREPIEVTLPNGRVVHVTGRSYAAMQAIARHWYRIRSLAVVLQHATAAYAVVEASIKADLTTERRGTLRKRLDRLEAFFITTTLELQQQRQAMYAHCFTESGAPAESLKDAPVWWAEIDEEGDARLLEALYEVGPMRYAKLGDPPQRDDGKSAPLAEDFGYASLLSFYESKHHAPPASYFSRDLQQTLTHARASAPGLLDDVGL